ncbi:hypothetical protein C0036_22235 [Streptomyces sp. DJ]|nr:hypothetical protein C0036_22235 [Streptomyces sp. DJ]
MTGDTFHLRSGGRLSTTAGEGPSSETLASAGGANHDGTPHRPLVLQAENVDGTLRPGEATDFRFWVDAGTAVGVGQQARVSYDLTGDGTFERVETFRYFASDPVPGHEEYAGSRSGLHSASGSLGDLDGGTIRVEIWNAIGDAPSTVQVETGSVLTVPFG